jgi:hypothetical protein
VSSVGINELNRMSWGMISVGEINKIYYWIVIDFVSKFRKKTDLSTKHLT